MSIFIEVQALQPLGPNNLNRDDSGSPKTVNYGGSIRARVSSQAWKRAIREGFHNDPTVSSDNLSMRTKRVVLTIVDRILAKDDTIDKETAIKAACKVLEKTKLKIKDSNNRGDLTYEFDALYFIGANALNKFTDMVIEAIKSGDAAAWAKDNEKLILKTAKEDHEVDVSLFGRMAANNVDLNVEATCQVAHAISVEEAAPEADYFTAVDDLAVAVDNDKGQLTASGAGYLDVNEFTTPTFFRYAVVNATNLADKNHLADKTKAAKVTAAFLRSFALTLPTGKQNAYASNSLPSLLYVSIKDTTPNNLVTAFQTPVNAPILKNATDRLVKAEEDYRDTFNLKPLNSWVVRVGEDTAEADQLGEHVTFEEMLASVETELEAKL